MCRKFQGSNSRTLVEDRFCRQSPINFSGFDDNKASDANNIQLWRYFIDCLIQDKKIINIKVWLFWRFLLS